MDANDEDEVHNDMIRINMKRMILLMTTMLISDHTMIMTKIIIYDHTMMMISDHTNNDYDI